MRWLPAAGVLFSLGAQVTPPLPPREGVTRLGGESQYGEAVFAELSSIAFSMESHQRRHVRTRGRLDMLEVNQYLLLSDGNARVLLLTVPEIPLAELTAFVGHALEVRGIVRTIRKKEYVGGVDLDLIEDPTLPVLPAPRLEWPKVSLTILGVSDREGGPRARGTTPAGRSSASELLANPAPVAAKAPPVVVVGLFRGRNLFGDLPPASQRTPTDWVLKDGETALWVTGKEPKGKGWALDPGYKADTTRWLEVAGKPEVANGVLYLQASKLRLVKGPEDTANEAPP